MGHPKSAVILHPGETRDLPGSLRPELCEPFPAGLFVEPTEDRGFRLTNQADEPITAWYIIRSKVAQLVQIPNELIQGWGEA